MSHLGEAHTLTAAVAVVSLMLAAALWVEINLDTTEAGKTVA
jgi:hypothetical protein